jgi:hypothetical protein
VQFLVNGTVVGTGTLTNGVATYTYTTSCANLAAVTAPKLPEGPTVGPAQQNGSWYDGGSGMVVAAGLLCILAPRRGRLSGLLVALVAVAVAGGLSGCGAGGTVAPAVTSSSAATNTSTTNGHLVITATYGGSSIYAGSIAAGISAAGFTTATSTVTPITVTVTPNGC